MKPVHIEFIDNTHWRWVWMATLLSGLGLMAFFIWQSVHLDHAVAQERSHISAIASKVDLPSAPAQTKEDPRWASMLQAAQSLQLDLNKAFAAAENIQQVGVRLRSLSLENSSTTLRLEYELSSMDQSSTITEALNAGYEQRPWHLESVKSTSTNGVRMVQGASMVPGTSVVYGIWSALMVDL